MLATSASLLVSVLSVQDPTTVVFTPTGYVESQFQVHLDDPERRVTDVRLNDDRALTLNANLAIGGTFEAGPVDAKVVLQYGRGQVLTYRAEDFDWRNVQEAHLGFEPCTGLEIRAGLFLSPVGIEVAPINGNWNWSRSNLYYALPAYHTGLRANWSVADGWTLTAAVYDGWNTALDKNDEKSVSLAASFVLGDVSGQVLYFGGVERASSDPEGLAWRHLLDAYVIVNLGGPELALQVDAGLEPNDVDTNSWLAAAGYVRLPLVKDALRLALRGDIFTEKHGVASPIFYPVPWVASGTLTLDWHALDHLRVMFELRHDQAERALYQSGTAKAQNTVTLGATAFF